MFTSGYWIDLFGKQESLFQQNLKNGKIFINNSIILLKHYLLQKINKYCIVDGILDRKNDYFRIKIDIFVKVKWRPKNYSTSQKFVRRGYTKN